MSQEAAAITETGGFSKALEVAAHTAAPEIIRNLRKVGREHFDALGLPNRRQEAWRFTPLRGIENEAFEAVTATAGRVDIAPWRVNGAHLLVFVDGIFSADLSDVSGLPDGVAVSNLVLGAASGSDAVARHLGSLAPLDEHPFAALNTALVADGAYIHMPVGVELERPIQLVFVCGPDGRATVSAPRVLAIAESRSRATIVEHHVGRDGSGLSCPVAEIVVGEGAALDHIVVQDEPLKTNNLAVRQVKVARDGRYAATSISLGGALARTDIGVVLEGEGADVNLDGLYLVDGEQQADTHITVRHASPNGTSHQLYKGILGGRSRAVFNGRIIVDQDAQKTDAKQSNRNLLLSDEALVNSNPQLEIFADDVRCTHGSAIGRLDDDAVFYLRSRGIGHGEAIQLLTVSFAGEVLHRIPLPALREQLEAKVASRLAALRKPEELT